MFYDKDLKRAKMSIEKHLGESVKVRFNKGRKKTATTYGVIESVHPSIFVVKSTKEKIPRKISYSYADLLTENIKVTLV